MSCFSLFLLACVDFQVRRPSFFTRPARPPGEYELSGCSYRPFVETGGRGSRESKYSMAILVCIAYFGFQKPFPAKRLLSLARSLELDVCT